MPFATRREERERFLFEAEEKTAAFHMAFHQRLGQGSQLQPLDPSIFRHIFPIERWAYPKIAVRQTPFCKDLASEFIALQTSSEAPKFKCRLTFMGATTMFERELPTKLFYRSPMGGTLRLTVTITTTADCVDLDVQLYRYSATQVIEEHSLVKTSIRHEASFRFHDLGVDVWAL